MKSIFTPFLFILAVLPASAQNEFLKPDGLAPAHGYTHVIVAKPGQLVILSGQLANNPQGQLIGKGDLKAQATQIFENIKIALSAAGATFNDVVKITYFVRDLKPTDLPAIRTVRDSYVNTAAPPASTLVGVASLLQEDYLIEIEATAVIPQKSGKKQPAK
jgi:enamine deaminase RidA (YjgF/YER057c/UK114 family)